MSMIGQVNEVMVSGVVDKIINKVESVSQNKVALLILINKRSLDDGTVSESKIQIKIPSHLLDSDFKNINRNDELLISGIIVVDAVKVEGKQVSIMRVQATKLVAHVPEPFEGFGGKRFIQN